jgi:hypothetical protein
VVQIVTLTGTLTNTREHGETRVHFGDVVDQFHNQNGFTNTGTTEQTNFTTLSVWCQKVDHFDACFQNLRCGCLLSKRRCLSMD